jgi:hypothetical protein
MLLAARLGLTLNTGYGAGEEKKLVERAITHPGPALISWQHGGIPDIAKAFPSVTPKPPPNWPNDRFDVVWTFTRTADGWHSPRCPSSCCPEIRTPSSRTDRRLAQFVAYGALVLHSQFRW